MNLCVSDEKVIVNIQGIRTVTWGENRSIYNSQPGHVWFVTISYKGMQYNYGYKTETEARSLFNKIREAMDKAYEGGKK